MIEQAMQAFQASSCFAPTVGCAGLMILLAILEIATFPFDVIKGLVRALREKE